MPNDTIVDLAVGFQDEIEQAKDQVDTIQAKLEESIELVDKAVHKNEDMVKLVEKKNKMIMVLGGRYTSSQKQVRQLVAEKQELTERLLLSGQSKTLRFGEAVKLSLRLLKRSLGYTLQGGE